MYFPDSVLAIKARVCKKRKFILHTAGFTMFPLSFHFQTVNSVKIFLQNRQRLLDIQIIFEYDSIVVHGGVAQLVRALA